MSSVKAALERQNVYTQSANREFKAAAKDKNLGEAAKAVGRGIEDSARAIALSGPVIVAAFKSDEFQDGIDNIGKSLKSLPQQLREASKRNMPEGGYKSTTGERY